MVSSNVNCENHALTKHMSIFLIYSGTILFVVTWMIFRYPVTLHQLHPEWLVIGFTAGIAWGIRHRMPLLTAVIILGFLQLSLTLFRQIPETGTWIKKLSSSNAPVWVIGKIRTREYTAETVRLHLKSVILQDVSHEKTLDEIIVELPGARNRGSRFYRNRHVHLNGQVSSTLIANQRINLTLIKWGIRSATPLISRWERLRNRLVLLLEDRAAFYLKPDSLSIYLPLSLARRTPFSATAKLFRQTGMAHLLAISGLHIALIYGLLFSVLKLTGIVFPRLMEWVHFNQACHLLVLIMLWGYVFLLNWPTPALRATCMISLLVLGRSLGQAQILLYSLSLTGFMVLVHDPAMIYDLSFQLSFLAVLFILLFIPFYPRFFKSDKLPLKLGKYALSSVLITAAVMLGTWPVLSSTFGRISFETFWLNLIMVPLLGIVVLPFCLLSLAISWFYLGKPPFMPLEAEVFALTEWVIDAWYHVMRQLHEWGSWAQMEWKLDWETPQFLVYYGSTLLLVKALLILKRHLHKSSTGEAGQLMESSHFFASMAAPRVGKRAPDSTDSSISAIRSFIPEWLRKRL